MDEDEFDSTMHLRPFGLDDARLAEAQFGRSATLGAALWGNLQRQLSAPYPEIPSGFELADFRHLLRSAQAILRLSGDPRFVTLGPFVRSWATISVGGQRFTEWEARCEIVRRAIEYLEKR